MDIEALEKLHHQTKNEHVNFMVHGTWTGLAEGHTHNCYGFEKQEDANSYAQQLNVKNGWENEDDRYIVTEFRAEE